MNLAAIVNLVVFALALAWLGYRRRQGMPLSTNVLIAVLLGALLGAAAQAVYGLGSPAITGADAVGRRRRRQLRAAAADGDRAAGAGLDPGRGHQAERHPLARQDQRRRARPAAGHHGGVGDDRHRHDPRVRPARRRPGAGRPRAGARHLHGGPARRGAGPQRPVAAPELRADQHLRRPGRHALDVGDRRRGLRGAARPGGAVAAQGQPRAGRPRAARASTRCRRWSCAWSGWSSASRPTACWR